MNETIKRRIKKQNRSYHKCFICGKTFRSDACPHSVSHQEIALAQYDREELLK